MADINTKPSHPLFNGRLSRSGLFIWFAVAFVVLAIALGNFQIGKSEAFLLFSLLCFPGLVRRAHDMGLGGPFCILLFIPGLNFLILLALILAPGNSEANQWGPPVTGNGISFSLISSTSGNSDSGKRERANRKRTDAARRDQLNTNSQHPAGMHPRPEGFGNAPLHGAGEHPLPEGFESEPTHGAGDHPLSDRFSSRNQSAGDIETETTFDFSFNLDDYSVEKLRKRWEDDDRE